MAHSLHRSDLDFEIAKDRIHSLYYAYVVLLSLISALEALMSVRGVFLFDFEKPTHIAYLVAYTVLFVASGLTLAALICNRYEKCSARLVARLVDVYGAVIMTWSAVISSIDVIRGNTMIVFFTVIAVVSALMNMRPVWYTVTATVLSVFLLFVCSRCNSPLIDTGGYYINLFVFILFTIILSFTQNRLIAREYIAKKQLRQLSFHDQLTGVFNRYSLRDYVAHMPASSIFYFGIVDVDNFKSVNDTYGHDMGDACLKDIADLLLSTFGRNIFRYGGDEFVIITVLRPTDLVRGIDGINATLKERYGEKNVHISAGFYCPVSDEETYTDYFKKADEALYEAKSTGKCRAVIHK